MGVETDPAAPHQAEVDYSEFKARAKFVAQVKGDESKHLDKTREAQAEMEVPGLDAEAKQTLQAKRDAHLDKVVHFARLAAKGTLDVDAASRKAAVNYSTNRAEYQQMAADEARASLHEKGSELDFEQTPAEQGAFVAAHRRADELQQEADKLRSDAGTLHSDSP